MIPSLKARWFLFTRTSFRTLIFSIFFVLLFSAVSLPANSAAAEKAVNDEPVLSVEIALFEYPPLFHTAKSGRISGLLAETLKEICKHARLDCNFYMRPVARAYAELEAGKFNALVTVKFERFKGCCLSSEWSYPWRSGIFSKKPLSQIPSQLEQMKNGDLILIRGWHSPYSYFGDQLTEIEERGELIIHRANTSQSSLRMLQKNRASYLWGGEEFQWFIERMEIDPVNFKPLLELPMVLWVSKGDAEIIHRFDRGYKKMSHLIDSNNQLIKELIQQRYEAP